uniref:(California timema) hypothetical protein n=1 Tax=Timema californicum TaxID=61474 RepID=A0A7R9JCT4_TIMCA|nr:unnamed protein product [Timema californicum]
MTSSDLVQVLATQNVYIQVKTYSERTLPIFLLSTKLAFSTILERWRRNQVVFAKKKDVISSVVMNMKKVICLVSYSFVRAPPIETSKVPSSLIIKDISKRHPSHYTKENLQVYVSMLEETSRAHILLLIHSLLQQNKRRVKLQNSLKSNGRFQVVWDNATHVTCELYIRSFGSISPVTMAGINSDAEVLEFPRVGDSFAQNPELVLWLGPPSGYIDGRGFRWIYSYSPLSSQSLNWSSCEEQSVIGEISHPNIRICRDVGDIHTVQEQ